MKPGIVLLTAVSLVYGLSCAEVAAWENEEHRRLGDSVYSAVMERHCLPSGDSAHLVSGGTAAIVLPRYAWPGMTFGSLCARFAGDDLARNRFHIRGRTVLEQLQTLTADQIADAWQKVSAWAATVGKDACGGSVPPPLDLPMGNAVTAYLLNHLMALRMAQSAADSGEDAPLRLRQAVVLEAIAQGYLADAFSAGHILTPVFDRLAPLHRRNTKEAHDYHAHRGVYVINSQGEAWQTFGDRLLHWYMPTYSPVFAACCSSLRELLVAFCSRGDTSLPPALASWLENVAPRTNPGQLTSSWLADHGGDYYYSERLMPTLLLLPMPIVASWSYRTEVTDEHGIRRRFHFPQLRDTGLHDPDLVVVDQEFFYAGSAVPAWLLPPPFTGERPATPDSLIRFHPDWASVRWIQKRYAPPSYKGVLPHVGVQFLSTAGRYQSSGIVGLGYGLWDDLLLIRNVSIDAVVMPSAYAPDDLILAPTAGFGISFSVVRGLQSLRLEGGPAFNLRSKSDHYGAVAALGFDAVVWPLRWTNVGLTWRLKYQWLYLGRTLHGPVLEMILQ